MSPLSEYTKMKYAGDCKCGHCQLVPIEVLADAIEAHGALLHAAAAVVAQWDTPNWRLEQPTAGLIADLHAAIAKAEGR